MKILAILAVIAILAFSIYALANKIKNSKTIAVGLFIILIAIISILTTNQKAIEVQHTKIMNVFNIGKTISCNQIDINKTNFNFISGTLVFMGKEKTDFYGQMISLDKCKL